ncbi:MAG: hypothetical protein BWY72_01801 [Bacteroidetes bacterium ADurb.Bin416]|nr:MAG: hypothetical protein BWY72_01801 [Bacteroidetes bacterium ADurb.Bin416]
MPGVPSAWVKCLVYSRTNVLFRRCSRSLYTFSMLLNNAVFARSNSADVKPKRFKRSTSSIIFCLASASFPLNGVAMKAKTCLVLVMEVTKPPISEKGEPGSRTSSLKRSLAMTEMTLSNKLAR